jgi:hypothetical protein
MAKEVSVEGRQTPSCTEKYALTHGFLCSAFGPYLNAQKGDREKISIAFLSNLLSTVED